MRWIDDLEAVRGLLADVTVEHLQDQAFWRHLTCLVQVLPDDDILPVRAGYGNDGQDNIALNHYTSPHPQWFTLADCIASALLSGKPPHVLQAIRFEPKDMQPGLRADAMVDFYKDLIDKRTAVKEQRDRARQNGLNDQAHKLDTEQEALKVRTNANSYGIFMEVNVIEHKEASEVTVYPGIGPPYSARLRNIEEAGVYYHPLLATLITGAARLMLALSNVGYGLPESPGHSAIPTAWRSPSLMT